MYRKLHAATPRSAGRRSVAFFVGRSKAPLTGALATLIGCAEPARPTFPAGAATDTTPPDIQFIAPPATDTVVSAGSAVGISIQVRDPSTVQAVACDITGAVAFSVPVTSPADTLFGMMFSVPTGRARTGRVSVKVTATDVWGNAGSKTFAFVVR